LDYPRKVSEHYVATTVPEDPAERMGLLEEEILSSPRLLDVMHKFGLYGKLLSTDGRDAAVREFRKQIKIQTSRGTSNGPSSFTITYSGDNPQMTAAVANELANSFIFKNLANREQQVQGTVTFISDQLEQARTDLRAQEDQLRVFRMGHLGEMPEQATTNLSAVGQLQVQFQAVSDKLAQLQEEKILVQNAPEADPALRNDTTPNPAAALTAKLEDEKARLSGLLSHLTLQHPDVIASQAKITDLEGQIEKLPKPPQAVAVSRGVDARLQVIEEQRSHLLGEQTAIRSRLDSYQSKLDAVPLRQEQLSALTRDYDTAREHYRSLLEKYYSAEMASELEEKQDADRFVVLDPAVAPEHPSSPSRSALLPFAVLCAFIASFMVAFGLERMDGSIKSEADLIRMMPRDLEFAGVIGKIAPPAPIMSRRLFEGI
jgi:uncharacterized protein involved in exopolysaccharide biosynthesis